MLIGVEDSDKLIQVFIHSSVFDIRVKLRSLYTKWWFNLEVGVISLYEHRVPNWQNHVDWNRSFWKTETSNVKLANFDMLPLNNSNSDLLTII